MPVRKIGLCYRSVSGRVPMGSSRRSVATESTLERDFVLLQRLDHDVATVEEQPVRIALPGPDGTSGHYVPDFLVTYRSADRCPLLVEVKYSSDPALTSGQLTTRLAAAADYARELGWCFALFTEKEIRTPRLDNARFLTPYQSRMVSMDRRRAIREAAATPISIRQLAARIADHGDVATALPDIWTSLATGALWSTLDEPITVDSIVRGFEDGASPPFPRQRPDSRGRSK